MAVFLGGVLLGAVNPVGPKLLTFPLTVGDKRHVFQSIAEWHSPNFQDLGGTFALVFLALALVILMRGGLPWRHLLPTVGFLALGLVALRNLPLLSVVLAAPLGDALRPAIRRDRRSDPRAVNVAFLSVIAIAVGVFAVSAISPYAIDLTSYPGRAARFLDTSGRLMSSEHRIAHQDVVGNFLEFRYGTKARVFIDDRYDMFPVAVADDYTTLLRGQRESEAVLDRYHIDTVLWDRSLPLVTLLDASPSWRQVHRSGKWVVFERTSS
jgi:hypothetical protein